MFLSAVLALFGCPVFGKAFYGGERTLDELDSPGVRKSLAIIGSSFVEEAVSLALGYGCWVGVRIQDGTQMMSRLICVRHGWEYRV